MRVVPMLALLTACGSVITPTDPDAGLPDAGGAGPFTMLYVPQYNLSQVRGYTAARLATDGDGATPDVRVDLPSGCLPNAVALDGDGDLWVTCNGLDQLVEIDEDDLDTTGAPAPKTVITTDGTALQDVIGLAFAANGNLWVACDERVEMYTPTSLVAGGARAPDRAVTWTGVNIPAGVIFDAAGNLWVSDAGADLIHVYTAVQLETNGLQTPILSISSPTAFSLVEGLAFDSSGYLYVASNNAGIAAFDSDDLEVPVTAATRELLPSFQIEESVDERTVRDAGGLVFDAAGNLYVVSQLDNDTGDDARILRFGDPQLDALTDDTELRAEVVVTNAASSPGFGGMALR
jgi:sugar lactone lactonase YvrE